MTCWRPPTANVSGVTSGDIRPDLQSVAVLSTTNGQAPDYTVNVGWGNQTRTGVMPGRGKMIGFNDPSEGYGERGPNTFFEVYLNETTFWKGIPAQTWDYVIGGYQVLKKWLSYRETSVLGRPLKPEEARDFMHIARRITALIALQDALDGNYRGAG